MIVVDKIRKEWDEIGELMLIAEFHKGEKKGTFSYTLVGRDEGIFECKYEEDEGEDVYDDIEEWVEEHIEFKTVVMLDNLEVTTSDVYPNGRLETLETIKKKIMG